MLDRSRRLFARATRRAERDAIAGWARRAGYVYKREQDGDGFAIDGQLEGTPWRLEWGPPQRRYIEGHELRMRMVLGAAARPADAAHDRSRCAERLAKRGVRAVRPRATRPALDDTAARRRAGWSSSRRSRSPARRSLRNCFAGVASLPHEGPAWLEGPLAHALERAAASWLNAQPPFLLMTLRGRIYLRLQLGSADEQDIAAALTLFGIAAAAARRVARARGDEPVAGRRRAAAPGSRCRPPTPATERGSAGARTFLRRKGREAGKERSCCELSRLRADSRAWTPRYACLSELHLRDRVAVHFVRAVGEAQGARAGVEAGEREVVARRRRRRAPASPSRSPGSAMFGATTLIIAISALAALLPATSIIHAAFSVSRRAMSIWQRASAMRSLRHALLRRPCLPNATRARGALAHQLERALGQADQAHAVVDAARARAGPARSRSRGLRRAGCCRPARARSRTASPCGRAARRRSRTR